MLVTERLALALAAMAAMSGALDSKQLVDHALQLASGALKSHSVVSETISLGDTHRSDEVAIIQNVIDLYIYENFLPPYRCAL